jgi:hypothetical protein
LPRRFTDVEARVPYHAAPKYMSVILTKKGIVTVWLDDAEMPLGIIIVEFSNEFLGRSEA